MTGPMAVQVLHILIFLLRLSYRFRVINPDVLEGVKKLSPGGNYLFAIWHRNILSYMAFFHGVPHVNLTSQSRDGALIARLLEKIGHGTVRGSSSRGGAGATMAFSRMLGRGHSGTITVDGPRGPAEVPKEGVFLIAKMSGVKIIPLVFRPRFCHRFEKSWDRFCLPFPFSKIDVFYGEPIEVKAECSRRDFALLADRLREALNE